MYYKFLNKNVIVKGEKQPEGDTLFYIHHYDGSSKTYTNIMERSKELQYYCSSVLELGYFSFTAKFKELSEEEAKLEIPEKYHIYFFDYDLQLLIKQILYG